MNTKPKDPVHPKASLDNLKAQLQSLLRDPLSDPDVSAMPVDSHSTPLEIAAVCANLLAAKIAILEAGCDPAKYEFGGMVGKSYTSIPVFGYNPTDIEIPHYEADSQGLQISKKYAEFYNARGELRLPREVIWSPERLWCAFRLAERAGISPDEVVNPAAYLREQMTRVQKAGGDASAWEFAIGEIECLFHPSIAAAMIELVNFGQHIPLKGTELLVELRAIRSGQAALGRSTKRYDAIVADVERFQASHPLLFDGTFPCFGGWRRSEVTSSWRKHFLQSVGAQ